jgi:NAD-dependent dihydropyrimidine dehydrogenase PreA subunit
MTFVITSPCLDTKDKACVDVCPVDCIHFDEKSDLMLYINPVECIDCGACEPACPVNAIFEEGGVPDDQNHFIEINALWYEDPDAARIKISSDTVAAPTAVKDIIETKKEPELIETTSVEKEISQDSSANEKDAQKEKPIVVSASSAQLSVRPHAGKQDFKKAIAGLEFPISRDGLLRGTKDKGGIDREVAMILEMINNSKFISEEELFAKIRSTYLSIGASPEDIPI